MKIDYQITKKLIMGAVDAYNETAPLKEQIRAGMQGTLDRIFDFTFEHGRVTEKGFGFFTTIDGLKETVRLKSVESIESHLKRIEKAGIIAVFGVAQPKGSKYPTYAGKRFICLNESLIHRYSEQEQSAQG